MAHETISADSHIVEPGDLWLTNIEPAFHDRAPRLVRADDGDVFVCDGNRLAGVNMIGGAGKDPATAKRHARLDEVRRGGWDPQARIKDMDVDGIKGEVLYPSVGLVLYRIEETDFLYACLRAYNTWLAEFCSHTTPIASEVWGWWRLRTRNVPSQNFTASDAWASMA